MVVIALSLTFAADWVKDLGIFDCYESATSAPHLIKALTNSGATPMTVTVPGDEKSLDSWVQGATQPTDGPTWSPTYATLKETPDFLIVLATRPYSLGPGLVGKTFFDVVQLDGAEAWTTSTIVQHSSNFLRRARRDWEVGPLGVYERISTLDPTEPGGPGGN